MTSKRGRRAFNGPQIYADEMSLLGFGTALWEPAPTTYTKVEIGDVGYISDGQFQFLFRACEAQGTRVEGQDVPRGFVQLDVGPILRPQPRMPGALQSKSVRRIGQDLSISSEIPLTSISASGHIKFESITNEGAILVTNHKTYRSNAQQLRRFKDYTRAHCKSWEEFAQEHGHDVEVQDIILVTGVDLTSDFSMLAFTQGEKNQEISFNVGAPQVASAAVSVWGSWRCEFPIVYQNWGPQETSPPSDDDAEASTRSTSIPLYDQCVFLRGFRVFVRTLLFTLLKASAGYHEPRSGSDDEHQACSTVQADVVSTSEPVLPAETKHVDAPTAIARYIFQNSNAQRSIVHDTDVAGLVSLADQPRSEAVMLSEILDTLKPRVHEDGDIAFIVIEVAPEDALRRTATVSNRASEGGDNSRSREKRDVSYPAQRSQDVTPVVPSGPRIPYMTQLSNYLQTRKQSDLLSHATIIMPMILFLTVKGSLVGEGSAPTHQGALEAAAMQALENVENWENLFKRTD
ncbi:hypothetical protein EIP91_004671 [Steccherinum ochraceum]|uniref:Uncharacterized protein n=1 Tax=Steccherinum ochraceum TaxID=92696 RepID=A0A4R0RBF9_9APHY|nr:hypothetical protein EIP91_004671 [Steccherinum ochraceum]